MLKKLRYSLKTFVLPLKRQTVFLRILIFHTFTFNFSLIVYQTAKHERLSCDLQKNPKPVLDDYKGLF